MLEFCRGLKLISDLVRPNTNPAATTYNQNPTIFLLYVYIFGQSYEERCYFLLGGEKKKEEKYRSSLKLLHNKTAQTCPEIRLFIFCFTLLLCHFYKEIELLVATRGNQNNAEHCNPVQLI